MHTVHDTTLLYDTIIVGRLVHDTTYVHDTIVHYDTVTLDRYIHDTVWRQITYHMLTVASAQSEKGIAIGSGRYSDSTIVEIAALPLSGNRFVQWSDGSAENPRHIQVTDDINLSATFEPDNTAVSTAEAAATTSPCRVPTASKYVSSMCWAGYWPPSTAKPTSRLSACPPPAYIWCKQATELPTALYLGS